MSRMADQFGESLAPFLIHPASDISDGQRLGFSNEREDHNLVFLYRTIQDFNPSSLLPKDFIISPLW